jgi:pyruvate,water dikinase
VVNDTGLAPELKDGDVLVAKVTDPSWMPLFLVAGAAAIDIGGAGSHGAIVARELGLPCVIGTLCGTRMIRTDDLVEVDGTHGVVRVIERAASR